MIDACYIRGINRIQRDLIAITNIQDGANENYEFQHK